MKINAPFRKMSEAEPLIEAGADNLYCGVIVPGSGDVNDRPNNITYNLPSLKALKASIDAVHRHGKTISVTCNLPSCDIRRSVSFVRQAEELGADEVIVSSIALLYALRDAELSCRVSLSCTNPVFSSRAMDFFRRFRIDKVCLPRHLSVDEVRVLNGRKGDVELEVFILSGLCVFVEGYCFARKCARRKGQNLEPCHYRWRVVSEADRRTRKTVEDQIFVRDLDCGLCALPAFIEMGVDSLKIEGRNFPLAEKKGYVLALRAMMRILEDRKPSLEEYRELAKEYLAEHWGQPCGPINCYY